MAYYPTLDVNKDLTLPYALHRVGDMNIKDNVLVTLAQAAPMFGVNIRTLRAWVEQGRLVAIRRAGRGGGGGGMLFARGEVGALVYAICPVCASGFKRATLKQRFCSTLCRQRFARTKLDPSATAPEPGK